MEPVAPSPGTGVRVAVPASSANLGPGFDSVGLALGIWDEYLVDVVDEPGIHVDVDGEGASDVPRDARHLVVRTMLHTFDVLGMPVPPGLRVVAHNAVPHSRGLGSSATAIVGGVVAAQALSLLAADPGSPPLRPDGSLRIDKAVANDIAAAIEGHPDNSSASVYGGATVSWMTDGRTGTAHVPLDQRISAVAFVPSDRLDTSVARAALPSTVPHGVAAANSGRAALLAIALSGRPDLLFPATQDALHQEFRRTAYPATMALVDHLRARGFAACVSGAGPSVLVLATHDEAHGIGLDDELFPGWVRLVPGIPASGVRATRR